MVFIAFTAIIMSAFGAFAAVRWNKRFEETLPVSVFASILILYVTGLAGVLKFANMLIYLIALCLWGGAVYLVVKKKAYKRFIGNMLTPASVFFAFALALFAYGAVGGVPMHWDEFTHWGTSVKIIFENNRLYSDPALSARFGSYPPAMGLFEYFFMKINGSWADWVMNFAYFFYAMAMFFRFFKKTTFKDLPKIFTFTTAFLLGVKLLFRDAFTNLQVDLLVGFTFAYAMAYLLLYDVTKEKFELVNLTLATAVLGIIKDSGALFAAAVAITYIIVYAVDNLHRIKGDFKKLLPAFAPLAVFGAAKLSWSANLKLSGTPIKFSEPYNIPEFISIVLGKDADWRSTLWTDFFRKIFVNLTEEKGIVKMDYGTYIFVGLVLLFAAVVIYNKTYPGKEKKTNIAYWATAVTVVVYVIGLVASYMYKFGAGEGLSFASMCRYMGLILTAVLAICAFVLAATDTNENKFKPGYILAALYLTVAITNNGVYREFFSRGYASGSANYTINQQTAGKNIKAIAQPGDKIAPIVLEDSLFNLYCIEYNLYPVITPQTISREIPFVITTREEKIDTWNSEGNYTVEKLVTTFEECDYDYLLLVTITDRFGAEYEKAFENPADIQNGNVFKLNTDTGRFYKVTP